MFFQLKGMKKAGSRWREYSFMLFLCRCFLGAHRETSGRIEIGLKMVFIILFDFIWKIL